jgi:hypothetical protein
MSDSPGAAKARVRDAVANLAAKGLDHVVTEVEQALASLWLLERKGAIMPADVAGHVGVVEDHLKKVAPPPPRKVKFDAPLRKIWPLAESSVRPGLDAAMLLAALMQVGDNTELPDKKRHQHELFLDDWRRMIWESARIPDWARFRALAGADERVLEGRLSREAALQTLEAIANRRADNITAIPDLSMLACSRCGGLRGRDRVRCGKCRATFCGRCISPDGALCLPEYAVRYAPIDPARRARIAGDLRTILSGYRLDAHTRNDAFVAALHEEGVDVVFHESAPPEGKEEAADQGRLRLTVRNREGAPTKRILFRSFARCYFRAVGSPGDPLLEDFAVDLSMGVPIEEALK